MASIRSVAVEIMKHLCTCTNHGYSQMARWGDETAECIVVDGREYWFAGGDRDCSSAIISAYKAAGLKLNGATYTGNMRKAFVDTGFFEVRGMDFIAQPGDIYLNEVNHTAMCISSVPDLLAEFSISETGGIDGQKGNQTGTEAHIGAYYDYPWDLILHWIGPEELEEEVTQDDINKIAQAVWACQIDCRDNGHFPASAVLSGIDWNTFTLEIDNLGRTIDKVNEVVIKLDQVVTKLDELSTKLDNTYHVVVEVQEQTKKGNFEEL